MPGITEWLGPMLRSKMRSILELPLSWKIIDAHERLRESESKAARSGAEKSAWRKQLFRGKRDSK